MDGRRKDDEDGHPTTSVIVSLTYTVYQNMCIYSIRAERHDICNSHLHDHSIKNPLGNTDLAVLKGYFA